MPTVLRVCSEPPEVRPAPVRAGGLGRLCARLVRMRTAVLVLRLSLTCGACGAGSSGFSRPAPVLMDSAASPWSPTLFTWTPPARETGAWARRGRVSVGTVPRFGSPMVFSPAGCQSQPRTPSGPALLVGVPPLLSVGGRPRFIPVSTRRSALSAYVRHV